MALNRSCTVPKCEKPHAVRRTASPQERCRRNCELGVEVEVELVRMWAKCHRIHVVLFLVVDVDVDQILGENTPLKQECMVSGQGVQ
jgi:hypothetical protein